MQMRQVLVVTGAALALAATGVAGTAGAARTAGTVRVSVSSEGQQGNDQSGELSAPALSRRGARVAFDSDAKNLVPGDTNGDTDVFVRDAKTGTTTRVSVSSSGAQAHGNSLVPAISANGRFVAFQSNADNLVPGDTNFRTDVFVHDLRTGATALVSQAADGGPADGPSFGASLSSNGQMVVFESQADNLVPGGSAGGTQVFVRNLRTGRTSLVGVNDAGQEGDQGAGAGSISADGGFVVFSSGSDDLVPDDTNGTVDVFERDLSAGTTTLVSVAG